MTKKLEILKKSLIKKEEIFNNKINEHFADVRSANGQPLNDKRTGHVTLKRWDKQNETLRKIDESIKKTKMAIEIEESKIRKVENFEIPEILKPFLESGQIVQWRKYPRFFFVKGVEKARICVMENGLIGYKYLSYIKDKEQFNLFKNVYEKIKEAEKAE